MADEVVNTPAGFPPSKCAQAPTGDGKANGFRQPAPGEQVVMGGATPAATEAVETPVTSETAPAVGGG